MTAVTLRNGASGKYREFSSLARTRQAATTREQKHFSLPKVNRTVCTIQPQS